MKGNCWIALLLYCCVCNHTLFAQHSKLDLSSSLWKFKKSADGSWYTASVPGCIHTDLLNNKLIDDPFYGSNESTLQWIENENWEYSATFYADQLLLSKEHINLVFEGLDTYASVFLNGKEIGSADNMFRQWKWNVKPLLKSGENKLTVKFISAANESKRLYSLLPAKLPMDERVMTRKAAYQFGWDWAPRFVSCGIWKPVYIESWKDARLGRAALSINKLDSAKANLTAKVNFNFTDGAKDTMHAELEIINKNTSETFRFAVAAGISAQSFPIEIKQPKLWWCRPLGDPYLYTFLFRLKQNGKVVDTLSISYGIRTIELVQGKDKIGQSFYFKINGVPVFAKGANYIPQDCFPSRVDSMKYVRLISNAVKMNMNMLRVWGGGIYENDLFYDLCDRNGILVWQDFMFACSMYPGDDKFLENVKEEVTENICRLRTHACIALWCGNNESDEGWKNWGWQEQFHYSKEDSARIWTDYKKLFHELIPACLLANDSGRVYWPSSPSIGWGHKESLQQGDSHYWGVWWGMEPFENYKKKTGRFMSEYGFQSMPSFQSIEKFIPDTERYLFSPSLKVHQKHSKGFETIDEYMNRDYTASADLDRYVYLSQLLQAEGMRTAMEAHRRAKPYCMGTLYWQLNDCWPVTSWSGMDYYGSWKALNYFAGETYAPLLVSMDETRDSISVYADWDGIEKIIPVSAEIKLINFSGVVLWSKKIQKKVSSLHTEKIISFSKQVLLKNQSGKRVFLHTEIEKDTLTRSENNFYFDKPKNLELIETTVQTSFSVNPDFKSFNLQLYSDVLAKNVYLSFEKMDVEFSDNFFDLLAGEKKTVKITPKQVSGFFTNQIKITCLNCKD